MLIPLLTNAPLYPKFAYRLKSNQQEYVELNLCDVLECSFGLYYKLIEYMGLSPLFRNILIGVPIGITFLDTVGYVARVEGVSMQPVLNPDIKQTDYVFLNRWAVRSYNIHHGDIVIFVSPKFPSQKLIKRVVGLSGDIVGTIGYRTPVVEVPDGHCWVEGDHTGHSMDSNSFGPVSLGLVTAKATCIVWPPSRWQYLKSAIPENRLPLHMSKPDAA